MVTIVRPTRADEILASIARFLPSQRPARHAHMTTVLPVSRAPSKKRHLQCAGGKYLFASTPSGVYRFAFRGGEFIPSADPELIVTRHAAVPSRI